MGAENGVLGVCGLFYLLMGWLGICYCLRCLFCEYLLYSFCVCGYTNEILPIKEATFLG